MCLTIDWPNWIQAGAAVVGLLIAILAFVVARQTYVIAKQTFEVTREYKAAYRRCRRNERTNKGTISLSPMYYKIKLQCPTEFHISQDIKFGEASNC